MGSIGSQVSEPLVLRIGNPGFPDWEAKSGPVVPKLGGIGSNMWEPSVPRAGGLWFQDWEAWVRFLELGTCGSKIGKHWFERWGTSPVVPKRLGRIGPRFGNQQFLKLETRGSKIGKHWFQGLGNSSPSNWEPVVSRLGRIGSKVWESAVLQTGNPWFQDWKPWVPTLQKFGSR